MKYYLLLLFVLSFSNNILAQSNSWYKFPPGTFLNSHRFIYVDDNDVKWIGNYDSGLYKFNNGQITRYHTNNSGLTNDDVRQSCFDNSGNLWITTWNKLNKFDTATNTWSSFAVSSTLRDILNSVQVDNDNRIWVGTDGGADPEDGLYMFDGSVWHFYNPTNSVMTGKSIKEIRKDATGTLWASQYNGFLEINGTSFTNHSLVAAGFPLNTFSMSFDFDRFNNKWVAVYDGGIGKFDGNNWTIYNSSNSPLPENKVWSIAVDDDNVVWVGTETKGLVKFDGTNWTVYNTTNSILTSNRIDALAVDKLNNVWIAPYNGGIVVHNSGSLSGVSGMVYHDINGNNTKDAGEPGIPDEIITIDSSLYTSITQQDGNYFCRILNQGSFTAKLKINSPYITSVVPDSIDFTMGNSVTNFVNKDFAVQFTAGMNDIAVDITAMNEARPGFPFSFNLTVKNAGTVVAEDIRIKLKYPAGSLILDSVSHPFLLHQGDSIIFLLDSLPVFSKEMIQVHFHLPVNLSLLGTQLTGYLSAFTINTADQDSSNNYHNSSQIIVGSYDPNDKQVDPAGIGATGAISSSTTDLTYTIRFQNTGTASAINVVVEDTLDTDLDLTSLKMLSSSHAYNVSIKHPNIIIWTFNNINLPDSNSNLAASNGYIKFNIKLKPGLAQGTELRNTGHIYFDFNPAILTNEVLNTINDLVVPVSLSYFSVLCKRNPELAWTTQIERGTRSFEVESSVDGINWVKQGIVLAKGDYSTYNFISFSPNRTLFRLCIRDVDGSKSYSEVISANCRDNMEVQIFPLPVKDRLFMNVSSKQDDYASVELLNMNSQLLSRITNVLQAGENRLSMDVSSLPAGIYFLRVKTRGSIKTCKIIKSL